MYEDDFLEARYEDLFHVDEDEDEDEDERCEADVKDGVCQWRLVGDICRNQINHLV